MIILKKSEKDILNSAITNKENISDANKILTKEFLTTPIIRIVGLVVIFVLSIIFSNRLSKLASMTSTAIFGNSMVLGSVSYFIILILALSLVIGVFGYGIYLNKKEHKCQQKEENISKFFQYIL